jgi:hypothetical protein
VIFSSGAARLNRENPAVARHVPLACAQLLGLMRAAGQDRAADALRGRMISALGVAPSALEAGTADRTR